MAENWQFSNASDDMQQTATVTGRTRIPLRYKINPIWWFGNDNEPDPPEWHKPGANRLWRKVSWYLRNPLENFGNYVIGVVDRNYTVGGDWPVMSPTRMEAGQGPGWKRHTIQLGKINLPFISYECDRLVFYAGWQAGGFFGFKLHPKGSWLQLW